MRIKDFFYVNRSDRMLVLLSLVVALLALAVFLLLGRGGTTSDLALPRDSTAGPVAGAAPRGSYYAQPSRRKVERIPFDPNTADSTTLLRLGLQPWQVRNIYKYRAAGGIYRRPSDFARLYGLTVKQYRELEPYIRISEDYRPASELYGGQYHSPSGGYSGPHRPYLESPAHGPRSKGDTLSRASQFVHKLRPTEHIALNTADTTDLKRVPGIGSYFARRIVSYRQRLGGFYSVEQLKEIDDFPLESLSYFKVEGPVTKMNVNKLSLKELKRHPYMNYYMAKAICDYRRLKGPLHSLSDLRLLRDFTPQTVERLSHYVEF